MCNIELEIPSIEEQRKKVEHYNIINNRIELLRKINDNLETQVHNKYLQIIHKKDANAIFKDIDSISSGKSLNNNLEGNIPIIGAGGIMGYTNQYNYDERVIITGRVGIHGIIQKVFKKCWATDNTFLGYDKGEDGKLKVNEEQAGTIKIIFRLYMLGYSAYHIKEKLEEMKIKLPMGRKAWHVSTVQNILRNEKYKGDVLLQKTYTVDFLTKKSKKNEGELPQVYVENAHDAIIDKKAFDLVQIETERRKGIKHYSGISIFSGKVYCGECGAFFGRKVWHSNDKYRNVVYRCNEKYNAEYNALVEESNKLNEKLTALENKIKDKESRMSVLTDYINTLKTCNKKLESFDEGLFAALLDKMIVHKDKVQVVWRDGSSVEVLK